MKAMKNIKLMKKKNQIIVANQDKIMKMEIKEEENVREHIIKNKSLNHSKNWKINNKKFSKKRKKA